MTDEITDVVVYVKGLKPIKFACPLDSAVLQSLCTFWANKSEVGDQIMSLEIGEENSSTLYFPVSAMRGLKSSIPLPDDLFSLELPDVDRDFLQLDINPVWIEWVEANRKRGAPVGKVYRVMLDKGVDPNVIREMLDYEPEQSLDITEREDRESIEPLLGLNIDPKYRYQSDYIELYAIDDFLDEESCDFFAACEGLTGERSMVYGTKSRNEGRTSQTFRYPNADGVNPQVREFQNRLCELFDTRLEFVEPVNCLVYDESQQFRAHQDYFDDDGSSYEAYDGTQRCGQRQWSVVIYLVDAESGSGTRFHRLRKEFNPKRGTALIWNNLYPSGKPNPYTHHAGLPVLSGKKMLLTGMIRRDVEAIAQ